MGILLVVNGNCVFNFLQWAEERKVKVFQKGERVVCGSKGVCVVEEITTLDIAGVDKKREYYILKPLYLSSSTVYIPVDTAEGSMRKVLAHEEAEKLIHRIPEIPLITIANDKLLEQEYKNRMIPLPTNKFCKNRYDPKKHQHCQYRSRHCVFNKSDHANEKHTCIDHTMCYHGHPVTSFHLFHLHSPSIPYDIFIM